jgi:VanZ family protein
VKPSAHHHQVLARLVAWIGVCAIVVLSIVPAEDRPVANHWITWIGQNSEHFIAFALVAGAFTIGYQIKLLQLLLMAFVFCGGIELAQIPFPTRHARISDFVVDLLGSFIAILCVTCARKMFSRFFSSRCES